jgi:hypothetical protein
MSYDAPAIIILRKKSRKCISTAKPLKNAIFKDYSPGLRSDLVDKHHVGSSLHDDPFAKGLPDDARLFHHGSIYFELRSVLPFKFLDSVCRKGGVRAIACVSSAEVFNTD